ncbi:MAG TPA: serine protease inhibitor [Micrococcaceae bacterium]|jgi:hypothetical protein|nr:serine protease inhibitor [Micrococcaceae bacterium]
MGKIHLRVPLLAAVVLIGLSACSSGPAGPSGSPTPGTSGGATPSSSAAGPGTTGGPHTDLTIEIRDSPSAVPTTYTLVCDGTSPSPSSTVADPAAACAALEKYGAAAFAPPTLGSRKCTAQYASSRVATVKGIFHGADVLANFSQTDGCRIATWNSLAPLFGGPAGVL